MLTNSTREIHHHFPAKTFTDTHAQSLSFPHTHSRSFHLASLNDPSRILLSPSSSCMCTTPLFVFLALVTVTLAPAYTFCARVCLSLTRARSLSHSIWTTSLALARSCSLLCSLVCSFSRSRSRLLPRSLALSYVRVGCQPYSLAHACVSPYPHMHTQSANNERQIAPLRPGPFDDPTAQEESWDTEVSASAAPLCPCKLVLGSTFSACSGRRSAAAGAGEPRV